MLICGIDEAGRGPIIGPLVMCGILIEEKEEEKLRKIEVKDSKLLTPKQRENLFGKIKKIVKDYKIIVISPEEIDKAVNGHDGLNLNRLEARKSAEIINELSPEKAIIDTPSNNIETYRKYLIKFIKNKNTNLILEHKADFNYPIVSAASILAKVTRDNEIERIKKQIRMDFGSGYMADPKTVSFLENYYEKYSYLFRKSWLPYQDILNKKFQKKLEDFSQFIEKIEDKDEKIIDKLKKLEDFGYKFVPASTEHEHVRLKGPCTITLYKSGKLLIQGREEDKKEVEKMLS
ncbi:ribonuclease HII [Candidatus Woesearchaeota archaeon]|nr:ribonuclease HII [Candidatus Woesearchaeota archaeon]